MTLCLILFWAATMSLLAVCVQQRLCASDFPSDSAVFLFCREDEDIKIAPSRKKDSCTILEPSSEEIDLYFKHKRCNNLKLAHQIGEELGNRILSFQLKDDHMVFSPEEITLTQMLYLFVAENCVYETISDPILMKAILAQMNDTISACLPHFYGSSFQSRSYTVYKLCAEQKTHSSLEEMAAQIGKCWAKNICKENDPVYCNLGCKLYLYINEQCLSLLTTAKFQPVYLNNQIKE